MRLVIVSLGPGAAAVREPVTGQLVTDVLWALATAADGVEHIAVRVGTERIDIGIFVRAGAQAPADQLAVGLVERAVRADSVLGGWNIEL